MTTPSCFGPKDNSYKERVNILSVLWCEQSPIYEPENYLTLPQVCSGLRCLSYSNTGVTPKQKSFLMCHHSTQEFCLSPSWIQSMHILKQHFTYIHPQLTREGLLSRIALPSSLADNHKHFDTTSTVQRTELKLNNRKIIVFNIYVPNKNAGPKKIFAQSVNTIWELALKALRTCCHIPA